MNVSIPKLNQYYIVLFMLPILTTPTVNLVGELMFSDIAVVILTPILLMNKNLNFSQPYLKPILILLFIWLISAVVSDIVNETSINNMMKGSAAIIFFAFHLLVFFVLINGRRERYTAAIIGSAVAVILKWVTASEGLYTQDLTETPWKMGGGFSITILTVVILSIFVKSEKVKGKALLFLAPVHLFLNARSLFLTTVLAGLVSGFQLKVSSEKTRKTLLMGTIGLVVLVFPVATSIYGNLNQAGVFGEEARVKYLKQTAGGEVNIIIAGRSESLVSFKAISDSPFLGHGSWAESAYYYTILLSQNEALGKQVHWSALDNREKLLIPSHSLLFGAWVYHGVFGAFFWFFILFITLKAIGNSIGTPGSKAIPTLSLLVLFALLWDIFFSPFGQVRRCFEAIYIVVACIVVSESKQKI
ncbi:hypothetical protein ACFOEW_00230 [Alteromonas oceani]|uniref:O-antigen ligase domain-containing protein n=1 Tax=Alteromonas oceani TaxID=2071609 RepID=A0ABV7JYC0_9ALTE|nr:hypothetical protein [Alteromonas oceani]